MSTNCLCCGVSIGAFSGGSVKSKDGKVCKLCSIVYPHHSFTDTDTLKKNYNENNRRADLFQKTTEFKAEDKSNKQNSKYMILDQVNNLFVILYGSGIGGFHRTTVYSFDEIDSYETQNTAGETISKSKGGVGRAVAGGLLFGGAGAMVGATTGKRSSTVINVQSEATIYLKTHMGKRTETIIGTTEILAFLDKILDEAEQDTEKKSLPETNNTSSTADELLKLKSLLDAGILTQDEFDAEKKKILSK